jgi:hypothetical protein
LFSPFTLAVFFSQNRSKNQGLLMFTEMGLAMAIAPQFLFPLDLLLPDQP